MKFFLMIFLSCLFFICLTAAAESKTLEPFLEKVWNFFVREDDNVV